MERGREGKTEIGRGATERDKEREIQRDNERQ